MVEVGAVDDCSALLIFSFFQFTEEAQQVCVEEWIEMDWR